MSVFIHFIHIQYNLVLVIQICGILCVKNKKSLESPCLRWSFMKLYLETVSHSCPVPRDKEVEDVVLTVWNVEAHDRLVPLLGQRDTPQLLLAPC